MDIVTNQGSENAQASSNDRLHAALDAFVATFTDTEACSAREVRAVAIERGHDLSWSTIACVMAALAAADAS